MRFLKHTLDASAEGDVIVLDKHTVGKIQTMVMTTAAAHRILVEQTQSRNGLACVQNARLGSGNRVHVTARSSSDSTHPLQQIEDYAFAGKNCASIVPDYRDRLAIMYAHAIKNFRMADDLVMPNCRLI